MGWYFSTGMLSSAKNSPDFGMAKSGLDIFPQSDIPLK